MILFSKQAAYFHKILHKCKVKANNEFHSFPCYTYVINLAEILIRYILNDEYNIFKNKG